MRVRGILGFVVALLVAVVAFAPVGPMHASAADDLPWTMASDTYYRLDVPNGSISATVHVSFRKSVAGNGNAKSLLLAAMPGATDIVVKQGDTTLSYTTSVRNDVTGTPTEVLATLSQELSTSPTTDVVMTYDVPAQSTALVKIEPGATEAVFVSQGPGSFMFIDLPQDGQNYVEPGCLQATNQPPDVRDAGFLRYICGEATIIALQTEDKSLQARCAGGDDACRQRYVTSPFAGFAQSVTDPAKQGKLEVDLPLSRGNVKLSLLYFRSDEAWAQRQFAYAQTAIPRLEKLFGFPYPRDTIQLRESHFIARVGALGLAFPDEGVMLITSDPSPGVADEEVTVHELAHQWAGRNLESPWLWEGLAEYGMRSLAPDMGFTPSDRRWQSFGYTDPLVNWGANPNADYWYGKAGAFWFAYQAAIGGPENMNKVLSMMDDDPSKLPLDGRWFMDRGEEVSGAKLDQLFLDWVWVPSTAKAQLDERRAARDLVSGLWARELDLGFSGVPTDIKANLDAWQFAPVADQVNQADGLLAAYKDVLAAGAAAGLTPSAAFANSWGVSSMATSKTLLADEMTAIQSIASANTRLANDPPGSFSHQQLDQAKAKFAGGDLTEAKRLAAGSTTTAFNQQTASKMVDLAHAKQASFHASFWGRIGLMFQDPAKQLADADAAYAAGDYTKAFTNARLSLNTWNNADATGMKRLAALAGLMSGLAVFAWWLLRKLEPHHEAPVRRTTRSFSMDLDGRPPMPARPLDARPKPGDSGDRGGGGGKAA